MNWTMNWNVNRNINMKSPYVLLCICIALFILGYVRSSLAPVPWAEARAVVRTSLSQFDLQMLYTKLPIWIVDRIVKPEDLLKTLFKYQFLTTVTAMIPIDTTDPPQRHSTRRARYTLLHLKPTSESPDDRHTFQAWHPKETAAASAADAPTVELDTLTSHQCIIVPVGGWTWIASTAVHAIYLYDVTTFVSKQLSGH